MINVFRRKPPVRGCWEVVQDTTGDGDERMWRVRWSLPDSDGRYLWVRHYPGSKWGEHAAHRNADEFNRQLREPWEWRTGAGVPTHIKGAGSATWADIPWPLILLALIYAACFIIWCFNASDQAG